MIPQKTFQSWSKTDAKYDIPPPIHSISYAQNQGSIPTSKVCVSSQIWSLGSSTEKSNKKQQRNYFVFNVVIK